jgi:hypothetical protein
MSCVIPQHSDFQIIFGPVTLNGGSFYFPTVTEWKFSIGPDLDGEPLFRKSNLTHAADFTIDPTGKTVAVKILSTGFEASGGSHGTYYVALYALSSGNLMTHQQTSIVIQNQIRS